MWLLCRRAEDLDQLVFTITKVLTLCVPWFTCPFCNHEKSCDVKMERTRNTGVISCTVCLEEFQTPITYLSEPVDVYSDWIDACEVANQ
uniref:Transcription elongation factor 1 homolog n=1 Tax=Knipowitschia caucasica TaxID=637954 RepID=A0AAV2LJ87_KNICA